MQAVGVLVGGLGGFNEQAIATYVRSFMREADNAAAMMDVCTDFAQNWKGGFKPSLPVVLDAYRHHPIVTTEREMRVAEALAAQGVPMKGCNGSGWVIGKDSLRKPCNLCNPFLSSIYMEGGDKWERWLAGTSLADLHNDLSQDRSGEMSAEYPMPQPCKPSTRQDPDQPPPRRVSVAEGMQIAADEFRAMYGRELGKPFNPNPVYAAEVIERIGTFDPIREVWVTSYTEVVREFRGDHARALASLQAIGSRLLHDTHGSLALQGVPDEPRSFQRAPAALEPVQRGEQPLGASAMVSKALGATLRHLDRRDEDF
jgi:hypothetical protein